VLEAKALPPLAVPVNSAPWSAQHLQAADGGADGSGGSEGGPAAGEQGPVEVWYEAVPAGNATAARGMAAGGAVRLTHGSYRIGGGLPWLATLCLSYGCVLVCEVVARLTPWTPAWL
jgi:hypothetical protein